MSGTWHWHRYVIPWKTISEIWHWHPTMCIKVPEYPLVFQVVQRVIQRLCQRHDKVHGRASRPSVTHGLPYGRVIWPCVPCTLIRLNRMPSSKHTSKDTAMCLSRVKDMTSGHGRVPRPCEVYT
ncbi:putative ATP-dependent RNA helicase A [Gossypium arboreum]|uniref:Putative ATP-dependent RNA helicase A n=1 Tax=Gossypium arboreum TaxID=29729 RepID=A0A0B0PSR6_GOSAR|nr:putative ATP-dependent RNA helicase A [Gossypium arboreum]